jgi:hypothetical protein
MQEDWEGSADESEACDGPQEGSDGWDGLQREQDEPMSKPIDKRVDELVDKFCSSCNHKTYGFWPLSYLQSLPAGELKSKTGPPYKAKGSIK